MQDLPDVSARYRLRRFKRSTDRDYISALGIYSSSIPPGTRTSSSEITYWVDHYDEHFKDEFCVCGFYDGSELVGYVHFLHRKEA